MSPGSDDHLRDLQRRLVDAERRLDRVPARWAQAAAPPSAPVYPWVQILAKGGQTLVIVAPKVYGIKRKAGEAKATSWIYLPRRATATAVLGSGATAGKVESAPLSDIGSCYISNPTVAVGAPPVGGTQAVITAAFSDGGQVDGAYITACGTLYGNPGVAVTFSAPPSGVTAAGQARVRDGKVVGITITGSGSGYVTAPTITVAASDGGGTLASAVAVLNKGKVTLTVTNQGAGYVTAPAVTIALPAQQPIPMPPQTADDVPAQWADGIGWGIIQGGSLTGGLATAQPALICHDDRSLVAYGLMGEGGSYLVPYSRPPDSTLTWYQTMIKLTIADANADGVISAWVPMACGG